MDAHGSAALEETTRMIQALILGYRDSFLSDTDTLGGDSIDLAMQSQVFLDLLDMIQVIQIHSTVFVNITQLKILSSHKQMLIRRNLDVFLQQMTANSE